MRLNRLISSAFVALLVSPAPFAASSAYAQDAAAGKAVFKAQCSICHAVRKGRNMIGPSLYGVVGRKAGAEPGFYYSAGNRNPSLVWDPATLDRYLTNPRAIVPDTTMGYPGLASASQRADLIAYLASLH